MNIFYLATSPDECARYHCDKHVVKMILETAQMLSTAHATEFKKTQELTTDGKFSYKYAYVVDKTVAEEKQIYKGVYPNHPSTIWVRDNLCNYLWAYELLENLCKEYTFRYNKTHKTESSGVLERLKEPPKLSVNGYAHCGVLTSMEHHFPPPLCMPDYCKPPFLRDEDSDYYMSGKFSYKDRELWEVQYGLNSGGKNTTMKAYRKYYLAEKADIARWKKRKKPDWFVEAESLQKKLSEITGSVY